MSDTSIENAFVFADRLRKEVSEAIVSYNDITVNYTISMGIAEVDESIENHEVWIECADAALYRSKESGRNKISLHPKQTKK